jgi:rubrerythrin
VTIAIAFENRTRALYLKLKEDVKNKHLVTLLDFLANEEIHHAGFLIDFKKKQNISVVSKDVQDAFRMKVTEVMVKVSGEVDPSAAQFELILSAMRVERQAEDLYRTLSQRFPDEEEIVAFFDLMAHFERTHYDLLDGIITQTDDFRMQS